MSNSSIGFLLATAIQSILLLTTTINKKDNAITTGAEGGEEVKMTELNDDLFLQVMVRNTTSPRVMGLDVRKSAITNSKTTKEGDKTCTMLKPATVAYKFAKRFGICAHPRSINRSHSAVPKIAFKKPPA